MADEEKVKESTEEQQEDTGSPSPKTPSLVSPGEASAPTFDSDALASATAEKLRPMIQEEVSRSFQSGKDRRFADVELISQYLQNAGGDVAKAARDMKLDEIYESLNSDGAAGTATQGSESSNAYMEARTEQLLAGAGMTFEDPDYKMLQAQYEGRITDPEQWISVVEGFTGQRQTKKAKQENIPGAAAASETGTVVAAEGDEDIESLTQELARLQALPKQTAETMAARKEVRARLTAQHDRQGVLDSVTFDKS